jgi:hypothetical protein
MLRLLQHVQKGMRIGPGHLHLSADDVGEFVENLHADRTANGDNRIRSNLPSQRSDLVDRHGVDKVKLLSPLSLP